MRRALALGLLALLATGIAACGGGGGSATDGTSADSDPTGKVTVWDFEYESIPGYTKAVDQIDAEFERLHPGLEIERVAQPVVGYEPVYRAAFTAHEGPDIMVFQPGAAGVLSFNPGLENLDGYISPEMQDELTEWETVTADFSADGEHRAVPVGYNGWAFYYNKQLFKQAGLPTDFEPQSWAEVREAGEKLQAAGIQPFAGGNKEGAENLYWFNLGFQTENTPEQTLELARGEIPYTDEAVTKAFGPEIEMQEAGLYPADRFSTPWLPDGYEPFKEGKAGMALGLWGVAGYWGEFIPELGEKNVGLFFAPDSALGTTANIAYGIPKFAKNKDAAWALIEYTTSKKGEETLQNVGGYFPNRKDVPVPADAPIQKQELLEAHSDRDLVFAPFSAVPAAVAFGPMLTEPSEVLQGRTSLEDAQKTMQEFAEKDSLE